MIVLIPLFESVQSREVQKWSLIAIIAETNDKSIWSKKGVNGRQHSTESLNL